VVRNLGDTMWGELTSSDDDWRCFCCDPSPLHAVLAHQAQLVEVPPPPPLPIRRPTFSRERVLGGA
jgi:hypothetical protein